jgi:ABC-2 type transport system permease protein
VRLAGRAPGWRWLLAHELRIGWRGSGGKGVWVLIALVAVFWAFAHVGAWWGMRNPALVMAGAPLVMAGLVTWFVILLIVATAFSLAVMSLFERGDLDLLFSSPIPPRTVLAVRGIAVAIQALGAFALLWIPFANGAILNGYWPALASYPMLLALGLGAAAVAFAATLSLVRALGARRAKTVAQIGGAFLGAAIFLSMQGFSFLPRGTQLKVIAWSRGDAAQSAIGPESLLWWPFRALMGDLLPFAAMMALCVGLFMLVVIRAERLFLEGSRESSTAPTRRAPPMRDFRAGLARIVVAKELRLIARDPRLISQILLQILYLLPLFFIMLRKDSARELMAPTIILIASTLASNLAWLTVSGEEAPDLVGSAPVSRERVLWLKLAAALAIPLAICAPFLAYCAPLSAAAFFSFLLCLAGALGSCGLVQIWGERPGSGRDLRKRAQSSKLLNLVEFFCAGGWAGACYLMLRGSWWATGAIAFALIAPAIAWLARRSRRG